jgi:hypothetical protein
VFLQGCHDLAVLGMDQRHRAQFGAAAEGGEHLAVVDHQGALVGHEIFEGGDAPLDHLGHVGADLRRPVGDRHVIGIVRTGALAATVPIGQGLHERLAVVRDAEVDRLGADVVVVRRGGAHEGHFEVGVGVDPARHHEAAGRVDGPVAGKVRPHGRDQFPLDQHIRRECPIGRHDGSALDHHRHRRSPRLSGP